MTDYSDQESRISAYLDGEMDDAATAAFEADLESDPALAAALERHMSNDQLLRSAFDGPMQESTDNALLERMGLAPQKSGAIIDFAAAAEKREAAKTAKAANDDSPPWHRWRWPALGTIVAALVFAFTLQTGKAPDGEDAFQMALEKNGSSQMARMGGGETLTPLLTFKASDGRYCREYSRGGGKVSGTGVACRGNDGWTNEAFAKVNTKLSDGKQIETASGSDPAALEEAYTRLDASDPIQSREEKNLISNGWNDFSK